MSQPKAKGCAFDLTKLSLTLDEQGDADSDALADEARSKRPVAGNSVSQIKGQTTDQPNAVDADANNLQSTKKAKAWKFDLTEFSHTVDEPNAGDQLDDQLESEGIEVTSSNGDVKSLKKKGWRLKWGRREK